MAVRVVRDIIGVGGLAAMTVGLWGLSPSLALAVLGAMLFGLALHAHVRSAR